MADEVNPQQQKSKTMLESFFNKVHAAKNVPGAVKVMLLNTVTNMSPEEMAYRVVRLGTGPLEEHLANQIEIQADNFRQYVGRKVFTAENFATDALAKKMLKAQKITVAYGYNRNNEKQRKAQNEQWLKVTGREASFDPIWAKRDRARRAGLKQHEIDSESSISRALQESMVLPKDS
jgi:hypothetical protein